ncbi:hypothetical protein EBU99_12245 [bacterium]|nr:hypothetical protein [bacterium]
MKHDSLGLIFKVEKRLGRGDIFEINSYFADGTYEQRKFHHESFDGMGALLEISEQWSGDEFRIPSFNLHSPVSFSSIRAGILGLIEDLRPSQTQWKQFQANATYTPEHVGWRIFSQPSSQLLREHARKNKVSLTVFLLWLVNTVAAEHLLAESQQLCRWLLPVNMRKSTLECLSKQNHTSSVGLQFSRSDTLAELERTYRHSLNKWRALATQSIAELSAGLGENNLYRLARLRGERNSWMGSFSNLGVWNFANARHNDHWPIAIAIAPPAGTPCFPIGIGVITWQGHLSLSLRVHAALVGQNHQLPETLLSSIVEAIAKVMGKHPEILFHSS